jgi:hypothetical protein
VSEAILNHVSGSRGGVVGVYQRHSWDAAKKATLAAWAANVVSLGACDGRRTFPSGLNQTPHTRQAMSQKGRFPALPRSPPIGRDAQKAVIAGRLGDRVESTRRGAETFSSRRSEAVSREKTRRGNAYGSWRFS